MAVRKYFAIFNIAVVTIVGSVLFLKQYEAKQPKTVSTWVWDHTTTVDLQFARNNGVNEMYYYVKTNTDFKTVSSLIEKANKMGIKVYALQGEPDWLYESDRINEWLTEVKRYNEQAAFPFEGAVLDIEPYLLDEWDRDSYKISVQFLSLVQKLKNKEKELSIKWTIPFWFDRIAVENGLSLAESILKEADEVIIMAYRNQLAGEDGLFEHIENERKWAETYKTSLIVAVETKKSEVEKISFYGKGRDHFQSSIDRLQEELKDEPYIEGISVHYLDTWKELMSAP